MASDKALTYRRELLEFLYKLDEESPGAFGGWHADRGDAECMPRKREADYLKQQGLITGAVGPDGEVSVKLTASGRDYVEAGGFWAAADVKATARSPAKSPSGFIDADRVFAKLAIEEARKSKSEDDRVHPMVGAVVVHDGKILAQAHRGELGPGDHGEFTVLEKKLAKSAVRDATIYVTLEPCTTRKHPKVCCALRLLERKVSRVVIGMVDPDPRISGRGITMLRGGRVEIAFFSEDLASDVEELNRDFIRSFKHDVVPPPSPAISPTQTNSQPLPPSKLPKPVGTPELREPLKALLAAVLPESQAHPRVVFLKELLGSDYMVTRVAFRREQKEFWLEAPKFYLTLKRGGDLHQEVFDWHADIEKVLLGLGLRATDGDEDARGAYLMLHNLTTADAAWGKDYCDAVLCEYLSELFATDERVMRVVREVPVHRASSSVHKTECLQYLQQALGGYLGSLMMELEYSTDESQEIFASAVAKMLDERCHVSSSKAMFPRR